MDAVLRNRKGDAFNRYSDFHVAFGIGDELCHRVNVHGLLRLVIVLTQTTGFERLDDVEEEGFVGGGNTELRTTDEHVFYNI